MFEDKLSQTWQLAERAPTLFKRSKHAACSTSDSRHIIATGGSENKSTCEIYSITSDTWRQLPDLNHPRSNHASCSLGQAVFVICGSAFFEKRYRRNGSIERLKLGDSTWESIKIEDSVGRGALGACAVSADEILILGGFGQKSRITNEHWLFNVVTRQIKRAAARGQRCVAPWANACTQIAPGIVLTKCYNSDKIIQYDRHTD